MTLLVLYVFHVFNDRVKNFLDKCIFYDKNTDFIIIVNDKNIKFDVPNYTNVKTFHRDNIGYDFGGWSDALLTDNLYEKYDHFVFMNSSCLGPFITSYYKGKWTDIYVEGLRDNIKLFGSSINTVGNPLYNAHVQSYIFSVDKHTLKFLIDCEIFSMTKYAHTFDEAIWEKEVLMSRKIIQNGWNIGSLLPYYQDVDFTFKTKMPHEYNITFLQDIMWPKYKDVLWNIFEVVFVKGNRVNPHLTYVPPDLLKK
jgi:hypothetical protein